MIFIFALLLTACAPASAPDSAPLAPAPLDAYRTQTPTPTQVRDPFTTAADPARPSPTPLLYTIATGDSFTRIADRFGVSVSDLQNANPGVAPNALTIGMTIRIPTGPQDALTVVPTPTPVPLRISQVDCFPGASGGKWCFALVDNPYPHPLENISARLMLINPNNEIVAEQMVVTVLNVIYPGRSLPLAAYFPPPLESGLAPRVQVSSSTALLPIDLRYLPAEAQNITVSVNWSGRSAQVTGSVVLLGDSVPASQVRLAAVVYDLQGQVVGVRRIELAGPLEPGARLPFDFEVGSLGGVIARVDVLAEALP